MMNTTDYENIWRKSLIHVTDEFALPPVVLQAGEAIIGTLENLSFFRYLTSLGKPTNNSLVTERIQYSVPDCFSATLAEYKKHLIHNLLPVYSLCSSNSSNG